MMKRYLTLGICLLVCAPAWAAGQLVNQVVAIINDGVVTQTELRRAIVMGYPQLANKSTRSLAYRKARQQTLDKLIDQRLLKQEVERANIQVDDAELDAAYQTFLANNQLTDTQLKQALAAQNITYQQFQQNVRDELKQMKFVSSELGQRVTLSDSELQYYYQRQRGAFESNNTLHVAQIVLPKSAEGEAKTLKAEHKHAKWVAKQARKKSFTAVAKEYSQSADATSGGDLGHVNPSNLPSEVAEQLVAMRPGEVSAPIASGDAYYIVKLVSQDAQVSAGYTRIKPQLEQAVYQSKMGSALDQYVADLRAKAYIEIVERK